MTSPSPLPLRRLVPVLRQVDREMNSLLREAADDALSRILRLAEKEGVGAQVRRAQYAQVRAELLKTMASLYQRVPAALRYEMEAAADAASAANKVIDDVLFREFGGTPDGLEEAHRAQAKETVKKYIARTSNNISLSDQVYRTQRLSSGYVSGQINRSILLGESWKELAARVKGSIQPNVRGGVSYAAKRLGRTEINNAFHTVAVDGMKRRPWVDAVRWNLSGSHPKTDVCDDYAGKSHYQGGSRGVFRKEEVPGKPHPQCLCFTTAESMSEDDFVNGFLRGDFDKYLDDVMGKTSSEIVAPSRSLRARR